MTASIPSTPNDSSANPQKRMPPNADYREVDRSKLSQMYLHYVEMKDKYPHALLLYRVGDFFETFFQDAITISE